MSRWTIIGEWASWPRSTPSMPSRPTGSADYFFIVIVIRHETTAAARWALPLIVRTLFNDAITVTIGTGFHVCLPVNNSASSCRSVARPGENRRIWLGLRLRSVFP
jgi:hypothetical protein